MQEAVRQYGKEFGASEMTELAETGKYWNLSTDLASGTSYTLVVEATNNYGKTKLIQSEPFRVGVPPYTGELAIGKYDMSYVADAENTFENVFEVVPTVGSGTEFFVKDFAMEDDTQWYATYDSGKSTLTLSGVQLGREKDGNLLLAQFTEVLTADQVPRLRYLFVCRRRERRQRSGRTDGGSGFETGLETGDRHRGSRCGLHGR